MGAGRKRRRRRLRRGRHRRPHLLLHLLLLEEKLLVTLLLLVGRPARRVLLLLCRAAEGRGFNARCARRGAVPDQPAFVLGRAAARRCPPPVAARCPPLGVEKQNPHVLGQVGRQHLPPVSGSTSVAGPWGAPVGTCGR